MSQYGTKIIGKTAIPLEVLASGYNDDAKWKVGGITLDWSTVTAAGADTPLPDQSVIKSGLKGLRLGQVLCLINGGEVETVTGTGGPTSGAFTLTLPTDGGLEAQTTAPISVTATALAVQEALEALERIGPGGVSVVRAGAGTLGSPYVWTATFARRLGNIPQLTVTITTVLGGGTSPSIDMATTTAGVGNGKYGPYDPAATDGRQTLARGDCYVLNQSVFELPYLAWLSIGNDYPAVIFGGTCRKNLLLITTGVHSLADGPTVTEFEAAFPQIAYVPEF